MLVRFSENVAMFFSLSEQQSSRSHRPSAPMRPRYTRLLASTSSPVSSQLLYSVLSANSPRYAPAVRATESPFVLILYLNKPPPSTPASSSPWALISRTRTFCFKFGAMNSKKIITVCYCIFGNPDHLHISTRIFESQFRRVSWWKLEFYLSIKFTAMEISRRLSKRFFFFFFFFVVNWKLQSFRKQNFKEFGWTEPAQT